MTTWTGSPYQGYLYAYPHKTAYRRLEPRPSLRDVWASHRGKPHFLYLHVPFCDMRCGFCNLFTRANPPGEQVAAYLRQLRHQAHVVRDAVGDPDTGDGPRIASTAIGGGTPTFVSPDQLHDLLDIAELMTAGTAVPLSVETSPATATTERISLLADRGTRRVSIGVQSFLDDEAHAAGRPQHRAVVDQALDTIRATAIPVLNIDLIYGIDGQTPQTWLESLRTALTWKPEELYLYPLYVRPVTGLGRRAQSTLDGVDPDWDTQRMTLYRIGRDTLCAAGYRQLSMRNFVRADVPQPVTDYCCQNDGMIGLGCGARSYTTDLHYSFDYAVGVGAVRGVLADYVSRPVEDFGYAEIGVRLDPWEQRRRWLLQSLLRAEGLDTKPYLNRFGTRIDEDFPQLAELVDRGWLAVDDESLTLTEEGLAHSDAIGPWLISAPVRAAMLDYPLR